MWLSEKKIWWHPTWVLDTSFSLYKYANICSVVGSALAAEDCYHCIVPVADLIVSFSSPVRFPFRGLKAFPPLLPLPSARLSCILNDTPFVWVFRYNCILTFLVSLDTCFEFRMALPQALQVVVCHCFDSLIHVACWLMMNSQSFVSWKKDRLLIYDLLKLFGLFRAEQLWNYV